MIPGPLLIDAATVGSTAAALAVAPRLPAPPPPGGRGRRGPGPGTALAAVTALVYLNQLLFTVYIVRVHGGRTGFIARHLPAGWFALADHEPGIQWLAAHTPAPGLLAPSLLRVQAFLELPFVLLVFMLLLRLVDPGLHRRVGGSPLVPAAAAGYTAVFCTVEWGLRNPYTGQDIAIRILSALVTVPVVRALARRDGAPARPASARGLLLLTASLWAVGHLVLDVYDTALLYNLGHLRGRLPGMLAALAVLGAVRWADRLPAPAPAGPAVAALADAVRRVFTLFLVPALAIRYGLGFGHLQVSGLCALVLLAAAVLPALRGRAPRTVLALAAAAAAGLLAACAAARLATGPYQEAALLAAMTVLLGTVTAGALLADRTKIAQPA
ncbi:hypothetical protein [Kitasatospora sp. NPDC059571]|uniref:hypothetical protein n=1 Tax=Kitasatospora sp. NPDC059571 TaxID=3346871 RepID=UPI00368AC8C0